MKQHRRRKKNNQKQLLLGLIAVLVVILVVTVIIALVAKPPQGGGDSTTAPSETTAPAPIKDLAVTQPASTDAVVLDSNCIFTGTADPREVLTIGGQQVAIAQDGSFSHAVTLQAGANTVSVTYRGKTTEYHLEHRYCVQNFLPGTKDATYNSGATVRVELFAREGSTISVKLGDKTVTMTLAENQVGSGIAQGFQRYVGSYKMPSSEVDKDMGKFTYTVTCNGITETYESGNITCKKLAEVLTSDPSVTPQYGDYMDVGSGYIVEIINFSAETFNGKTTDDNSDPRNNYLPKGTVDYASQNVLNANNLQYMSLRCGYRVYVEKPNWPSKEKVQVVDCYRGTLPDHNEIGFVGMQQTDSHTYLNFECLFKAPFFFDIGPQAYIDPNDRDFRVSALTAEYVDITFCYATVFTGTVEFPDDNPLFTKAELTQNTSDCTLRLYLKKAGCFYGWNAYYNDQDQLCFRFLHPAKASTASNAYGANLSGVRVMIDVGHGGIDGGTSAEVGGELVVEADLNLRLAEILKEKLESMGAEVILNRSDNSPLNVDERIQLLIQEAPDLCISLHQNSIKGYPNHSGAQVLYFTPFSQHISQLVYEETVASGVYKKTLLDWHIYFVARQTTCPVVLTENGYMSNAGDLAGMMDESVLGKKADSMAQAVADYFLRIQ